MRSFRVDWDGEMNKSHDLLARNVVGRGLTSVVYRWEAGTVLKLFPAETSSSIVEREFAATRAIHSLHLPVPAAHGIVEVEGRMGIILEHIPGVSLLGQARAKPWTILKITRQLAELHATIHRCEAPAEFITQRESLRQKIAAVAGFTMDERERVQQLVNDLPDGDTLCHGDFHPENVIASPRGLVVIDWETATRGTPAGDVACTSRLMQTADLPSWAPFYMHLLLRASRGLLHRTYLNEYTRRQPTSREEIKKWEEALAATARSGRVVMPLENTCGKPC